MSRAATYDLARRVALVTGGAGRIGAACAAKLAACGARVAVADVDGDGAARVASSVGGGAIALALDVTDSAAVDAAVGEVVARMGGLDIAVNNAGVSGSALPFCEVDDEEWRSVLAIDLDGVFFCMRAELRAMRVRGGGSIVNLASILSSVAFPEHAPYVAAKHGLLGLTRAAALDHAPDGIRVNAVAPGFVHNARTERRAREDVEALAASHLLGRIGEPEEVAELVAWLSSDAASFATGSVHAVDGGYLAV